MIPVRSRNLVRENRPVTVWAQIVLDYGVVQALFYLHTVFRNETFDTEYQTLAILIFLMMALIYNQAGVYQHHSSDGDYLSRIMQAWGTLLLVLAILGFITKTTEIYSREVLLTWSVTSFLAQVFIYFVIQRAFGRASSDTIPTIVIGSGDLGKHIASHLKDNPWVLERSLGIVAIDSSTFDSWDGEVPLLGTLDDLETILAESGARRAYIALPLSEGALIKPLSDQLAEHQVDIIWAPDIFGVSLLNHSVKEIAGVPLISLSETPLTGGAALAKTALDLTVAIIALILASPIMIITAIAIKLTSRGPVLFVQKRHGWDGRILEIFKFRSMVVHQETDAVTQATRSDPRITAVGRFIRRTSIDELPQLFNVLNGSM